jgi:hypothetical protein
MKVKQKIKSIYATCLITGKQHYIYGPTLQRKVAKFGSVESFLSNFISTKAKKLLKEGLSQDEVRQKLKIKAKLPEIAEQILIRNKIKKVNKRQKKSGISYIDTAEYAAKKKIENETINNWDSWKSYVENATGGPNGCQIKHGGTCQQPHIWFGNGEYCDGCSYYQYCLVGNKRLLKRR